jgi:hypothetical protein
MSKKVDYFLSLNALLGTYGVKTSLLMSNHDYFICAEALWPEKTAMVEAMDVIFRSTAKMEFGGTHEIEVFARDIASALVAERIRMGMHINRMIKEAVDAERERCAKIVEDMIDDTVFPVPAKIRIPQLIRREA